MSFEKEHQSHQYDDMIDLPHHVSGKHPQMPLIDRAAQFSPFAALTGYEAAIREMQELAIERVEMEVEGIQEWEMFLTEEDDRQDTEEKA